MVEEAPPVAATRWRHLHTVCEQQEEERKEGRETRREGGREGNGEERKREVGERRGDKVEQTSPPPAWNRQPGSIGSHTCSSLLGHWVVLFSLGETPSVLPAAPVPSLSSRSGADGAPDGRSAPRAMDGSAPKH